MLAGILLTVGRYSQTENSWTALFQELSDRVTVASVFAFIMQYLVQFSGITLFIGGVLCYRNHVRSGKELVGLGTGVGLADLLLDFVKGTFTLYQPLGWSGLAIAIFAGRHIHGPQATYVEEVRRLITSAKGHLLHQKNPKRQARRKYSRRSPNRPVKASTGQYDLSHDKKREG